MEPFKDYYEILQVHPLAEPEIIEAAYKKLAQKYHPDVNQSSTAIEKMKEINVAHDILSNPITRQEYYADWSQHNGQPPQTKQYKLKIQIKDHKWHDLEYINLKNWVKRRKDKLIAGFELKGRTFCYRLNPVTNKYQFRLRHKYNSAIYNSY